MKLRCPYCRQEHGPEAQAFCPHCGKVMRLPDHLLSPAQREKRRRRERALKEQERNVDRQTLREALAQRQPAILLVLLALLILAGASLATRTTAVTRRTARPPTERAAANLAALRVALERFRVDCGRYPTAAEGLKALVRDDAFIGWRGQYVNRVRPDPWQRPFIYRSDGQSLTLLSVGADGVEGTADDIVPAAPTPEVVAGEDGRWQKPGSERAPTNSPGADAPPASGNEAGPGVATNRTSAPPT